MKVRSVLLKSCNPNSPKIREFNSPLDPAHGMHLIYVRRLLQKDLIFLSQYRWAQAESESRS